jgi:biotin carboxyl carrier protein
LMDLDYIKELVRLFEEHDLAELEISSLPFRVRITKSFSTKRTIEQRVSSLPVQQTLFARVSNKQRYVLVRSDWDEGPNKGLVIGRFYLAENPDDPDYKPIMEEGRLVKEGEVLYYLDALSLISLVVSPVTGIVREILVEHKTPIDYGKELFVIERT